MRTALAKTIMGGAWALVVGVFCLAFGVVWAEHGLVPALAVPGSIVAVVVVVGAVVWASENYHA